MDFDLNYLSINKCIASEEGDKEVINIDTISSLEEENQRLKDFLHSQIVQTLKKTPSLTPTASCRVWDFSEEENSDKIICSQLLNAVSIDTYKSNASLIAKKYIRSPKSRSGILFILTANVTVGKMKAPFLFIIKSDFKTAMNSIESDIQTLDSVMTSDLEKAMMYPRFDGLNFQYEQIRIYQKKQSDYFEKIFRLESGKDSNQISDEILLEELDKKKEGNKKYFEIPECDRNCKRDIFGESRLVEDLDLMLPDEISHISKLVQQKIVDQNIKPSVLSLNIDNQMKFSSRVDLLNQTYYFAKHGLEKFLIIRGSRFESKGCFKAIEFMELETLKETFDRIGTENCTQEMLDFNSGSLKRAKCLGMGKDGN